MNTVVRVTPGLHWHALDDDVVAGRGYAMRRPDGRVFISVDSWVDDTFATLAEAMIADLDAPLYTVVSVDDREHLGRWALLGFRDNRRDDEYFVPVSTDAVDLADAVLPPGFSAIGADQVDEERLLTLEQQLRQDQPGHDGWASSPERFHAGVLQNRFFDPSTYLIAVHEGEYVAAVRIWNMRRHAKLSMIGVLPPFRRRGLARALLALAFRPLRERGVAGIAAEADESDPAARALLLSVGAKRTGAAVELILHS
jgi:ribosomal protein S18 acetylase RimI-like enzyme